MHMHTCMHTHMHAHTHARSHTHTHNSQSNTLTHTHSWYHTPPIHTHTKDRKSTCTNVITVHTATKPVFSFSAKFSSENIKEEHKKDRSSCVWHFAKVNRGCKLLFRSGFHRRRFTPLLNDQSALQHSPNQTDKISGEAVVRYKQVRNPWRDSWGIHRGRTRITRGGNQLHGLAWTARTVQTRCQKRQQESVWWKVRERKKEASNRNKLGRSKKRC